MTAHVFENTNVLPEDPGILWLKPAIFTFCDSTTVNALLAMDDKIKTFLYPMSTAINNHLEFPALAFFREAVRIGSDVFRDMARRAYEEKKTIKFIGFGDIHWIEYEAMFGEASFYSKYVPAKIIDFSTGKSVPDGITVETEALVKEEKEKKATTVAGKKKKKVV